MSLNSSYNSNEKKSDSSQKQSFFQSFFASLFGGSNPEAEKKRKLKALAKTISKTKYHTFYKTNSSEMTESFAKLMFDIYKVVFSAQQLFKNTQNVSLFKHKIINFSLSEKQHDLLAQIDEQKIAEMSRQIEINKLTEQVEEKLQLFLSEFDSAKTAKIEAIYKAYTLFKDFC